MTTAKAPQPYLNRKTPYVNKRVDSGDLDRHVKDADIDHVLDLADDFLLELRLWTRDKGISPEWAVKRATLYFEAVAPMMGSNEKFFE